VLYLSNHGINSRVFCDCFSMILVSARARYLAILTLNQVLWLLVVEFYRITYSRPPPLGSLRRHERSITEWWRKVYRNLQKDIRRGLNSAIILGAWSLWKLCNARVFEGDQPQVQAVMHAYLEECHLWCLVGAVKPRELGPGLGVP
jgi:hypothetical protein